MSLVKSSTCVRHGVLSPSIDRIKPWRLFVTAMHPTMLCIAALTVIVGCPTGRSSDNCEAGQVYADGQCAKVCNNHSDCPAEDLCAPSGTCMAPNGPPSINSIDGDDSIDSAQGHAPHHVARSLVVRGSNLAKTTASLLNGGGTMLFSNLSMTADQHGKVLTVALPAATQAGSYALKVTNQAGSATKEITLLQGERGKDGTCDASQCTASDASPFPGVSRVSIIKLLAQGVTREDATIEVETADRQESFVLSVDGIYVVAVRRDTHEVDTDYTNGPYLVTDTTNLAADLSVLATSAAHFVCLVSRGDVTDMLASQDVTEALLDLGASDALATLTGNGAFVFAGYAGIGDRGAALSVGEVAAEMTVVFLDDRILGHASAPRVGVDPSGGLAQGERGEMKLIACGENEILKSTNGAWQCGTDVDTSTTYSGTDFATSGQSCSETEKVTGISSVGTLVCSADVDTDTTYSGADFATSGQSCSGTQKVTGISATGGVVCSPDVDTNVDEITTEGWITNGVGAIKLNGDLKDDSNRTVLDSGGGWHRSYGNTGWYNGTHQGGWYMVDSIWVRSYGNKDVHTGGKVQANNGFHVGGTTVIDGNGKLVVAKYVNGISTPTYSAYTPRRYIFEATAAEVGRLVTIPANIVNELCQDDDGCGLTLAMVDWVRRSQPNNVASVKAHLFIASSNYWRRSSDHAGEGRNGADGIQSELKAWDCYFTEADTRTNNNNGRSDNNTNWGLLNCQGCDHSDTTTTCRLIIDD